MAFPTIEATVETSFSTATTSHAVAMPSTVNAGDLLLVAFFADNDYADEDVPAPSGFTLVGSWTWMNGSTPRGGIWAKAAAGTEGGTTVDFATTSTAEGYAHCLRLSGWGGTVATDIDVGTIVYGSSDTIDMEPVTAGWGSDDNLFLVTLGHHAEDAITANPSGYTTVATGDSGSGTPLVAGRTASQEVAAATDDPGSFTLSGYRRYAGWTLVVKPGSSSPVSVSVTAPPTDFGMEANPQSMTNVRVTIVDDNLSFFWDAMPATAVTSGVGAGVTVAGKAATISFDAASGNVTITSEGSAGVFTPPTYRVSFADENESGPSLMRWFSFPVGYTVIITGGVATPYPGVAVPRSSTMEAADAGSGDNGKAVFRNGVSYTVTDAERTALRAAGYTVT